MSYGIFKIGRMEKQLKKKIVLTVIGGILLLFCYYMIFMFSADNAEESTGISRKVTDMLMRAYYKLFGGSSAPVVPAGEYVGLVYEDAVRKLAHFVEYMAVGFLSFGILMMWISAWKKGAGMVLIQLLVSAALDEFHQYFVPGRYASVKDVLIDTAGGIMGIAIIVCTKGIKRRWKRTPKQESEICS